MEIIGISGDKGAGKDSIANVLVEEFGFYPLAPGDLIRKSLSVIFNIPVSEMENRETKEKHRKLQQDFGIAIRKFASDDFVWIKAAVERARKDGVSRLVIPSVRGEEDFVKSQGGKIWFVTRPGLVKDENDGHEIEQFAAKANPAGYDCHIVNDSTLEALADKVKAAYA